MEFGTNNRPVRREEGATGSQDLPEIVLDLLGEQAQFGESGADVADSLAPTELLTERIPGRENPAQIAAQDARWSRALRSTLSPERATELETIRASIFGEDSIEHRTLAAELPPLLTPEEELQATAAQTTVNEIAAYEAATEKAPVRPKSKKQIQMEARVRRMQQRRAQMQAEAAERATERMDALERRLDEEDRKKELAEKVAKAEALMRQQELEKQKQAAVEAWQAEQARLMLQHETERRLAQARVDMPKNGLSWKAHAAMVGLVAAGLVAISFVDRDPGGPSREQAAATMAPDLDEELAGAGAGGGDRTQPVSAENARIVEPSAPEYADAETAPIAERQFVPEQSVATVLESPIDNPVVESPARVEVAKVDSAPQPSEQVQETPAQIEQPQAGGARPQQVEQSATAVQVEEVPAMTELTADMGSLRKVTIGPLTIKRGLFGKLKLQHAEVPGWTPLSEEMAEVLLDTYQVDVERGFASSSAYAMTSDQFMQMVPDNSRMKRRWTRKQQRKNSA